MEEYKTTEVIEKEDGQITYIWHPGIIPPNIPVQQVYGFAHTSDNLVALVRDKGEMRFTPPGGAVESGESVEEALVREFKEEVQFIPKNIKLLGSLEVINPNAIIEIQKHNLQVRYVCVPETMTEFIPGKDGFETEERIFVHYTDLPHYLGFVQKYTTGKIQYEMLKDYLERKITL